MLSPRGTDAGRAQDGYPKPSPNAARPVTPVLVLPHAFPTFGRGVAGRPL